MSENTKTIEQHAEGAARSLDALVADLQNRGIEYPLEAYRILGYLTCAAGEMRTVLELIGTSMQSLQDKGLLMSDFRGEPLDEVLQRFMESSAAAKDLAGRLNHKLSKAHSAVGHIAYRETPEEQESAAGI